MFYDKFADLCDKKGITPNKAAAEIGFDRTSVSKWKKKGFTPHNKTLVKISQYFGVSVDYLSDNEEVCIVDLILQRIIDEMKLKNIKQYELTDYLDINRNSFGNWKAGLNKSYLKYKHAIADFLDVSVDYLEGKTDIKKAPKTSVSDDEIKFALWGDVASKIPDEKLQEVKNFADYIKSTICKG